MIVGIRGRLFGPELPTAGADARAEWQGDTLSFDCLGRKLISSPLRITSSGFNRQQLRFSWSTHLGEHAFLIGDEAAARELLANAPDHYKVELLATRAAQYRLERRFRRLIGTAVGFALLLSGMAGWLILSAPRWSAALADKIPVEQEVRLGELVLKQTRASMPTSDSGVAAEAIRQIGTKLTAGSRYRYRWYVATSPELNAFAAPGGIVVVTTGLIAASDTPEEVAGVLAHEVAHAELRHGLRAIIKSLGVSATIGWIFGVVDRDLSSVAGQFAELKFSRDAEREADEEGLRRMRVASLDETGMLRMFLKLESQSGNPSKVPEFLSTHPDIQARIDWLRARFQQDSPRIATPLRMNWLEIKSTLPR